jgi:hypothetical protein
VALPPGGTRAQASAPLAAQGLASISGLADPSTSCQRTVWQQLSPTPPPGWQGSHQGWSLRCGDAMCTAEFAHHVAPSESGRFRRGSSCRLSPKSTPPDWQGRRNRQGLAPKGLLAQQQSASCVCALHTSPRVHARSPVRSTCPCVFTTGRCVCPRPSYARQALVDAGLAGCGTVSRIPPHGTAGPASARAGTQVALEESCRPNAQIARNSGTQ